MNDSVQTIVNTGVESITFSGSDILVLNQTSQEGHLPPKEIAGRVAANARCVAVRPVKGLSQAGTVAASAENSVIYRREGGGRE